MMTSTLLLPEQLIDYSSQNAYLKVFGSSKDKAISIDVSIKEIYNLDDYIDTTTFSFHEKIINSNFSVLFDSTQMRQISQHDFNALKDSRKSRYLDEKIL